ncbi:MAG: 30S ribosomal protein S7 [Candidatus Lloydbacteria bacterium RIFCSPHIGHO2_02_FULL_51_22]|uniref:Small ribosomal subunit protein uS7 n=3 Tax=Candidatus Lloydiibacteriota TaxID=1817910 RepID=A0A1G2DG91_9BACT|nr:MAG: 30S ribosomal protein S7 [Candidatus Lloydbacteria bacterium RIFCSPHIGHO2_02_FULL_51_22]OGZ15824.1 MAG: 30S ribosomal protein S7 [Candidatus Lloydbacteria bacterium RIFCSPLOWO2_02_FULL_51_11]OGZ16137.1 MAG: 30S ribosomal protein S7 [Candidatus Lloydbacteria bacterium RIFCSPLOWO2_12_FULL_51_9]
MARRPIKKRPITDPDYRYNSIKVEKLINYVMESGKKETSRKIVYSAFALLKEKTGNENPLEVFDKALKNVSPTMEVRSRRVGGANYTIPREVRPDRKVTLALRWIIEAARARKGTPMHIKLAEELLAAAKNEGPAVQKKINTHKMAEANRAFAHFAW